MTFVDPEYQLAAFRFPNLARAVCSSPWLVLMVVPGPPERTVQRFKERYPYERNPHPHARPLMRRCPLCERIGPVNGIRMACCDCEADMAEVAFQQRLESAGSELVRRQLNTRWFRPRVHPARIAESPHTVVHRIEPHNATDVPMAEDRSAIDSYDSEDPADAAGEVYRRLKWDQRESALQVAHHRLGIRSPSVRFTDPIPMSSLRHLPFIVAADIQPILRRLDGRQAINACRAAATLRQACRVLGDFAIKASRGEIVLRYNGRVRRLLRYQRDYNSPSMSAGSGWSVGCAFKLLSEKESDLRAEIERFRQQQKEHPEASDYEHIIPSAKRFTRANPMLGAPEDGRAVLDCLVDLRDDEDR